jgi:hypothetical protein
MDDDVSRRLWRQETLQQAQQGKADGMGTWASMWCSHSVVKKYQYQYRYCKLRPLCWSVTMDYSVMTAQIIYHNTECVLRGHNCYLAISRLPQHHLKIFSIHYVRFAGPYNEQCA